ncbi:MAG TPA: hypothetical protein VFV10_05725 [Gammaproteobacteria bacterium]|nr:hypothetical protein [Gammaproteobacteria bacterium]
MRTLLGAATLALLPVMLLAQAPTPAPGAPPGDGTIQQQQTQLQQMQQSLEEMQKQMSEIQATRDPEARQRLMREHMQSMQNAMSMMGRMTMMGQMHGGAAARPGKQCADNDTKCELDSLERSQQLMQQQMGMMQGMMGQMMQHMEAQMQMMQTMMQTQRGGGAQEHGH